MRLGRGAKGLVALSAALAVAAFVAGPAQAAFPVGSNGSIAYQGIDVPSLGFEVSSMNPDGSGQHDLTNSADYEISASYSPDGRRILFARALADGVTDIWVMNADGTGQVQLTHTPTLREVDPVFSPDGKKIAYTTDQEYPPAHLYLMNADGSGQHALTDAPTNDLNPDFSPDGSRIAFDRCQGPCDIFTISPDGTGITDITDTATTYEADPSYSPDGRRIAVSYSAGSGVRIATINGDGTGPVVFDNPGFSPNSPAFSPDGRLIAFSGQPPMNIGDIFTINAGGSGVTNVTKSDAREEVPTWQWVFSCGGRQATIVGSDAGEKLKGTKGPDVIVGNGGNDRIKGLAGRDRLCGGTGRDRLAGGKGAKDLCRGQQGKDYGGKGCEKGKL
jgi:dipeptidyl aminopeptidase/acylaminoacyl peptidase